MSVRDLLCTRPGRSVMQLPMLRPRTPPLLRTHRSNSRNFPQRNSSPGPPCKRKRFGDLDYTETATTPRERRCTGRPSAGVTRRNRPCEKWEYSPQFAEDREASRKHGGEKFGAKYHARLVADELRGCGSWTGCTRPAGCGRSGPGHPRPSACHRAGWSARIPTRWARWGHGREGLVVSDDSQPAHVRTTAAAAIGARRRRIAQLRPYPIPNVTASHLRNAWRSRPKGPIDLISFRDRIFCGFPDLLMILSLVTALAHHRSAPMGGWLARSVTRARPRGNGRVMGSPGRWASMRARCGVRPVRPVRRAWL